MGPVYRLLLALRRVCARSHTYEQLRVPAAAGKTPLLRARHRPLRPAPPIIRALFYSALNLQGSDKCSSGPPSCTSPALYKCIGGQCVPEATGVSKQVCDQVCAPQLEITASTSRGGPGALLTIG